MEMDFLRPNDLSNEEAIKIVGQFFPHEWKQLKPEDVSIGRAQTGVNNEVYFVSRKEAGESKEPEKVVVRIYSSVMGGRKGAKEKHPVLGVMVASEVEQILILTKLADRGLGPELLGVFDGGRVEEFIDCHKITFDEAHDPEIEVDVAKNMARIHSTKVPLRKPGCDFMWLLRALHADLKQGLSFFEKLGDEKLLQAVSHDFESDFQFMDPLLDWKHNRMVLMNWDPHLDNVVLLNKPVEGRLKTVIFDFEMAANNIRGKDLGLFIISRCGFFPIAREDRRLESAEQTAGFLRAYQQEILAEFEDIDVDGKDSLDHLMLETLVGGMVSASLFLLLISGRCILVGDDPISAKMMPFLVPLFDGFKQCRDAIKDRFPDVSRVYARD